MFEVKMKYMNNIESYDILNFKCEKFDIGNSGYKFENILMENFKLNDLEVNNEDIASIMIR